MPKPKDAPAHPNKQQDSPKNNKNNKDNKKNAHETAQPQAPVFPGVAFCPTGGIDERSAGDYLALPNVPMIGGSWIAPSDAIAAGDWPRIRCLAERAAAIGHAEAA